MADSSKRCDGVDTGRARWRVVSVAMVVAAGCVADSGVPLEAQAPLSLRELHELAARVQAQLTLTPEDRASLVAFRSLQWETLDDTTRGSIERMTAELAADGEDVGDLDALARRVLREDEARLREIGEGVQRVVLERTDPRAATDVASRRAPLVDGGATAAAVVGVLACAGSIAACLADVAEAYNDCLAQICPEGTHLDAACCLQKAYGGALSGDDFNCSLTCGANGPDDDFGNCCKPKPQPRSE